MDGQSPTDTGRGARLRVLLAEDNEVNQRVAVLLLERLGHRADVVANGLEAVRAVTDTAYDVVLMDVQMPELDGIAATERIRAALPAERQPRIVAMTAGALAEDRERCLDAGMDDVLGKPVRREALAAALARGEPPVVDPSVLGVLSERLGERAPAFLGGLLSTWEGETARRLDELDAAVDAGAAARAAHALQGGSAAVGALRLAAACAAVEQDVRTGRPVDLPAVRARLRSEAERAGEALVRLHGP